MSYRVVTTKKFERRLKKLHKKYRSILVDIAPIFMDLTENPKLGKAIGYDCYKIRVAISSKGKGKSGGARLITYFQFVNGVVFLIDMYDKSEQEDISDADLRELIEELPEE
jgi:mRNA-degrading endonuclease RelE of RelBE toxin-antitoxin system